MSADAGVLLVLACVAALLLWPVVEIMLPMPWRFRLRGWPLRSRCCEALTYGYCTPFGDVIRCQVCRRDLHSDGTPV